MTIDSWVSLWSLTLYGSLLGVALVTAFVLYSVFTGARD